MKTFPGLILIFLLVLASCSYSDPEMYYAEPVPGDSTSVVLTTSLDTVEDAVVIDSLLFSFRAEVEGGKLYFTEASMGNISLYQNDANYDPDTLTESYVLADSFWLSRLIPVPQGENSMFLTLYYSSNTNSLADKVGLEAFTIEEEYIINMGGVK
jgi:hypothetical protein